MTRKPSNEKKEGTDKGYIKTLKIFSGAIRKFISEKRYCKKSVGQEKEFSLKTKNRGHLNGLPTVEET